MVKVSGRFEVRDGWRTNRRTYQNDFYISYTRDYQSLAPQERTIQSLFRYLIDQADAKGKKTNCEVKFTICQIKYYARRRGKGFFKTVTLPLTPNQPPLPKPAKRNGKFRIHFRGYYVVMMDWDNDVGMWLFHQNLKDLKD